VWEFFVGTLTEDSIRISGTDFSTGGAGGVKAGPSSEVGISVRVQPAGSP
jgi:hypothetical protein